MRIALLALLAPTALLLSACLTTSGASPNAIPMVLVRAEHDLDCPQREIRVEMGLGGRATAIGCGHKASYLTGCEGLQCTVNDADHPIPWRARPDPVGTP